MKVITIVGARPQFVKAAVASRAMVKANVSELLIHTGQHFDHNMSDLFFEQMEIPPPAYHLGVSGGRHGEMTGRMLEAIEEVLVAESPDVVLIYGDTNSTLAGALAASKLHIPVAHVEAGLRSFDRKMPEEINRVLSDHVSDLLFVPTEVAEQNLVCEGIDRTRIRRVGDVMFDAALYYRTKAKREPSAYEEAGPYVLATVHRQENVDAAERLSAIFEGLRRMAREIPVVLPIHPRTARALKTHQISTDGIRIIDAVGYLQMIQLQERATFIATDSGGVQKEAFFFKRPALVLRDRTEWSELVDGGYATLVDADPDRIIEGMHAVLKKQPDWGVNLYGDGHAAEEIVASLVEAYGSA